MIRLSQVASVCVICAALFVVAHAQQARKKTALNAVPVTPPAIDATAQTNANENFELNISERRITEHDFHASTSVEAGEESAHGLNLRIGVSVGANDIDMFLRNVRGQVRFRASLDPLLRVIDARRNLAPTTSPSP